MRREGGNHGPEEGALSEGTWRKRGRTEQRRRVPSSTGGRGSCMWRGSCPLDRFPP